MGYFDSVKAHPSVVDAPPASNVVQIRSGDIHPYAQAIRAAWLNRLDTVPRPWMKGAAWDSNCFVAARKLIELANSPWAGYTRADAHNDYLTHAPHDSVWDKREKCWEQALDRAQGVALPEPPPNAPLPELTIINEPSDSEITDFWESRELLAHLHTYARARSVAPWATLGNALARVIASTHPSIVLPPIVGGYASLNLFVGVVGRSGTGKGAAESVAKEAIDVGTCGELVGDRGAIQVRNTGSGEGAVHAYMKRTKEGLEQHTTSVLFSIPEIDSLGAVGARQGATIMSLLRSGWSGEQLGFQYADPAKNLLVPAHHYRMCLVAGIQPGRAGTLLDDADGGTPQRFLWLPAIDPEAPEILPAAPEPKTLHQHQPITVGPAGVVAMDVCHTARTTIVTERRKAVRGEGEALDGHSLLTRLKTAAALALMDKRRNISEEDWQLSGVIAAMSDATRSRVIAHRQDELRKISMGRALAEAERQIFVGDTMAERAVARVARGLLRKIENDALTHSDARKTLRSADRVYYDEAVEHLVKAGQITVSKTSNGSILTKVEVKP